MKLNICIKKIWAIVLLGLITQSLFSQERAYNGTVLSPDGNPIENVEISLIENPGIQLFTGSQGDFSIIADPSGYIVFEYQNRFKKVVPLSDLEENSNIVLGNPSDQLNDLGYNSFQRNEELASSVETIYREKLNKSVPTTGEALFGQIPGLRVFESSGLFPDDREPDFDIRGIATTQDNSVLVLIDGVERPLNTVTINEIESISVLRDVAAKARYGQMGANGVLLVKTKRGFYGKTDYNISVERGITQPRRIPGFLKAPAYARALNEGMVNDGLSPKYSQLDINNFESGNYPTFWPNVDWVDQILSSHGQFSKINFNFSGGGEYVKFFVGFNYQNEQGLFKHTDSFDAFSTQIDYDKLNFRSNLDIEVTKSTDVQLNVAGYIQAEKQPNAMNIVNSVFAIPSALFPVKNYDGSWGGTTQFDNNPVAGISETGYILVHERNFLGDLRIKQDLSFITKGLNASIFGAVDARSSYNEGKSKKFVYKEVIPVVDELGNITDTLVNELGEDTDLSPFRSLGSNQILHYDIRGKLQFSRIIRHHAINSWLMYQQEMLQLPGTNQQFRNQNFAGNVHYGLNKKYFFDGTLSYFGTNRIQEKNDRYGLFPAIGGAWIISSESFLKDSEFIDFLKLRASYGKAGNGRISINNLTRSAFSGAGSNFVVGNSFNTPGGMVESVIPIDNKSFEISLESNLGIQAILFNNVELNGEFFNVRRESILVPAIGQYSELIGILPQEVPAGIVENKGYELSFTWNDKIGEFSYLLSGMFTQYKNKIISINEEYRPYDYMKREGNPIGQFYGWNTVGFYQDENDIVNSSIPQFGEVKPGDIKYEDRNGDGVIDQFDEQPIGTSSVPEIYYSANMGLGYKGFNLSVLFQGAGNSSAYLNKPNIFWPLRSTTGNISTWYENYWTEGDKSGAELPRLTSKSNENNFRPNDIWIRDNSFLKLRYAEISYTLPPGFNNIFNLQQTQIYLRGTNLLTFDDIKYLDPENTGADYPVLKTYNVGLKVTF